MCGEGVVGAWWTGSYLMGHPLRRVLDVCTCLALMLVDCLLRMWLVAGTGAVHGGRRHCCGAGPVLLRLC